MPGTFMNQTTLTIAGIVLTSLLSTVGSTYQTNKANEEKEQRAAIKIVSEFNGVKNAVDNFSTQLSSLRLEGGVLKSEVSSLQEWRRDINKRVRDVEIKVR